MGRSPGGGHGNPLQHSCLENPRDGGAWWAAVYGVAQGRTRLKQLSTHSSVGKESACSAETLVQFLGWEDPLEEEMATHSSILAWRIPWTEEPGRLQSIGSTGVGQDLATKPTNTIQNRSSGQFSHSVVSNSLRSHEPQHPRPPCPSPTNRVYSNSCPLSW